MPAYPVPDQETERQRTLEDFQLLDGPADEDLDRLTRLASRMLGLPIALISLVDRHRQWFLSRVGLETSETSRDLAFCAHAICGDEVMVVPDASDDERFRDNPLVLGSPHIRFYAGVPLRSREGHNLGTLCVIGSEPRQLSDSERQLLEDLAALVMQHLEAHRRSWRCPLTGLLNRRPFFAEGGRELDRARRHHAPLSLVVLDLDAFTAHNETFGRSSGDRVLRQVAATVARECRSIDLTGRVAGDEIAVLMPESDLKDAEAFAERLGGLVATSVFADTPASAQLTVSRAAAQLEGCDRSFAALYGRAEAALDWARRHGGNLTVKATSAAAASLPPGPGTEPS
jgi:diguanylate cyclase (GGDEF)-like protein